MNPNFFPEIYKILNNVALRKGLITKDQNWYEEYDDFNQPCFTLRVRCRLCQKELGASGSAGRRVYRHGLDHIKEYNLTVFI